MLSEKFRTIGIDKKRYETSEQRELRQNEVWDGRYNLKHSILSGVLRKTIPGRVKNLGFLPFGCYHDEFLWHIERQFTVLPYMPESKFMMEWGNKGMWQIDHIIPRWSFAHYDHQAMRECWHWTNLRPLWLSQNKKKSGHIQHSWHVLFSVRKFWMPSETFIGEDGLMHHNGEKELKK